MTRILAGDLGGTHLRLAIVEREGPAWRFGAERSVSSRELAGLLPAVRAFLDSNGSVEAACIGVAGPVIGGRARLSNLDWSVDAGELARGTGIARTRVINDFEAVARAVPELGPGDLAELHPGAPAEDGEPEPLAVIGPGTGLGQAFLVWEDGRYRPHASEGGHADYAPAGPEEYALHAHLAEAYGHVSVERVVSGPGLVATYRFLAARAGRPVHADVERATTAGGDPAAEVSRLALEKGDRAAVEALTLFVRTLARQAAGFALGVRATGGVYLAGGIPPKILPALREGSFMRAFLDKGRMADLLARVPVRVVVAPRVGLLGAAAAALDP